MFTYRPPKASCWGHAIHPNNTLKAVQKMHGFFDKYFEPIVAEKLSLHLNPFGDDEKHVPKLREKAVQIFGEPGLAGSMDWVLGPGDYQRAVNFILKNHPSPKQSGDPIWLTLACALKWKHSALPHVDWPDDFLKPGNERSQQWLCRANLQRGGRFMFVMGILIPLSSQEPATYEFLGRFSEDAPFKMSPKHFKLIAPAGNKGKWGSKKMDAGILEKLQAVIK